MNAPAVLRNAMSADARSIAEVHVASWRSAYRGALPDEILDSLSVEKRERTWRDILGRDPEGGFTLVAEAEGRIVGFCSVRTPSPDPDLGSNVAEVGALYVAPDVWRRGIGTALLVRAMSELRIRGCRRVALWLLAGHAQALDFYARLGFAPDGAKRVREQTGGRRDPPRLAASLAETGG
jgi:GNAT superfamily N-acetyltransferase